MLLLVWILRLNKDHEGLCHFLLDILIGCRGKRLCVCFPAEALGLKTEKLHAEIIKEFMSKGAMKRPRVEPFRVRSIVRCLLGHHPVLLRVAIPTAGT